MDNPQYHILGSENYDAIQPTAENIWKYLHPYFEKWAMMGLQYYIDGSTGETVSYKEMLTMSLCWAKELSKYYQGSSPPNVLLVLPNSVECATAIFGCFAIGAPVCSARIGLSDDYLKNVLFKTFKPSIIVVDSQLSLWNVKNVLEEFNLGIPYTIYVKGATVPNEFNSFERIIYSKDEISAESVGQYDGKTTNLHGFSSGTTGIPKAFPISSTKLIGSAQCLSHELCCIFKSTTNTETEILLANTSMAHPFGIIIFCIVSVEFGCQVVDFEDSDSKKIYEAIQKFQPTVLVGRPFMMEYFSKWEECTQEGLSSIRVAAIAGCPPNAKSLLALKEKTNNRLIIQNMYGLSEVGFVASTPLNQKKLEMSGIVYPGVKIRIVNLETGEDVKDPYQRGEVFVASRYCLIAGYIDNPKANADSFTSDGWFRTGDIGYFDEEDFINIEDRIKDIITLGNKKVVLPTAIENIILKHSSVKEVGVIGVPRSDGEEVPRAFIVKQGPLEAEEIKEFVEKNGLPEMKLSGGVDFIDEIPRNPLGKVLRKMLREKPMR